MNSALLLRYYLKESFWSALMDHFHFPSLEFQSLFIVAPLFGISSIVGPDVAEQTLCFVFFKERNKKPSSLSHRLSGQLFDSGLTASEKLPNSLMFAV